MISKISGEQITFHEQVLLVPHSQRSVVESTLERCGCRGEWSCAGTSVETFSSFKEGSSVSLWAMSLANKEDAQKVQSALDAID